MATTPYFAISPNTILSLIGILCRPDRTVATPAEDWRNATIDVVIPAFNEERNIALCLAALARQTKRPRQIILIDDGSTDKTLRYATAFCTVNGIRLVSIQRESSIGKTPTLKRQARELDSDVEFILDADTILVSENYLERVVQELYQGVGIASACGLVLPMRKQDRTALLMTQPLERFLEAEPDASLAFPDGWRRSINRGIVILYREVLYLFLQYFVYRGQMIRYGTIANPIGCAVAYRRKYVQALFDHYEPLLGDNLTNSEDIFIGFGLLRQGYRNIHLTDVLARTVEPEATRLPRQLYLWSSSFLQSCYYFDDLLRSPFKAFKRYRYTRRAQGQFQEKRRIQEPYRQAFGVEYTQTYGRPIGWALLLTMMEKIFFPTALLIMFILQMWEPIGITVLAETLLWCIILAIVLPQGKLEFFLKGLLISPIWFIILCYDLVTIGRFAADIWFFGDRHWRK